MTLTLLRCAELRRARWRSAASACGKIVLATRPIAPAGVRTVRSAPGASRSESRVEPARLARLENRKLGWRGFRAKRADYKSAIQVDCRRLGVRDDLLDRRSRALARSFWIAELHSALWTEDF